jgi:7-carboxy-7-deazaguanine synthase
MSSFMLWENLAYLGSKDQVKFVIANREDYLWAKEVIFKHHLPVYTQVLFSPVYGELAPQKLARWILEDRLPVRFQLQLHKVLWGERRGV